MVLEDVSSLLYESPDTPFDLIDARRNVLDYHTQYGMPVVIKRAYNSDHAAMGKGPQGENVRRDTTYDPAFGQGFFSPSGSIGDNQFVEYGPGWFTYVTLSDSVVDDSDPSNRGAQKKFITQGEMPWTPLLWDNDLLILVEIEKISDSEARIVAAEDRFVVQGITPITMRGQATQFYIPNQESQALYFRDKNRFIAQQFQAVRMPRYHRVYDMPII
jgi:hypothetical protein